MNRFILFICVVLLLAGCKTREVQEHVEHETKQVEKTTTVTEQPTIMPDGQIVTLTSTQTIYREQVEKGTADRELHEKTDYPAAEAVIQAGAKVVAGAAGFTAGQITGGGILALVTAVSGLWATHKTTQANAEKKRADWHEADADAAYKQLLPSKPAPNPSVPA